MKGKRVLAVCLSFFVLAAAFLPGKAFGMEGDEAAYTTEEGTEKTGTLSEAFQQAASDGTVRLLRDISVTGECSVTGKKITLLGEDHVITLEEGGASHSIFVQNDGVLCLGQEGYEKTLTVISKDDTSSVFTVGNNLFSGDKAVLYMHKGVTIGPSVSHGTAAGIQLHQNGKLVMLGGEITKCINDASVCGGVLLNGNASFEMKDGKISHCEGIVGGAVSILDAGSFTMEGGSIEECVSNGGQGGGVYMGTSYFGYFTMLGGKITRCTAGGSSSKKYGGGMFIHTGGSVNLQKGAIVENTANHGGGIITFMVHGLTISPEFLLCNNTASVEGDDIFYRSGVITSLSLPPKATVNTTGEEIDGWYMDGGWFHKRWNPKAQGETDPYVVRLEDLSALAQGTALKAAHGEIFSIKVIETAGGSGLASHTEAVAGTPITLTAMPQEGYQLKTWEMRDSSQSSEIWTECGSSFEMPKHPVEVRPVFEAVPVEATYTITAKAEENGTISPNGEVSVKEGENASFTFMPEEGYEVSDVLVDGKSVGKADSYTFSNVSDNHTVTVQFQKKSGGSSGGTLSTVHIIQAAAGEGGSITPAGAVSVTQGENQSFQIVPLSGYKIKDVLVDGQSVGAVSKYDFTQVEKDHKIEAFFVKNTAPSGSAKSDEDPTGGMLEKNDHLIYLLGYPGHTFGPEKNMTRAEAAMMFYRLLVNKNVPVTASFRDVSDAAWYGKAVRVLASLGILEGTGNELFTPNRPITRGEFTAIAMRFGKFESSTENPFTDVKKKDWYYPYVVGSSGYGWIQGYPDGTFRPENCITRAEVTAVVNRMLNRKADKAYVAAHGEEICKFFDVTLSHWAYYDIVEATNYHTYQRQGEEEIWLSIIP